MPITETSIGNTGLISDTAEGVNEEQSKNDGLDHIAVVSIVIIAVILLLIIIVLAIAFIVYKYRSNYFYYF